MHAYHYTKVQQGTFNTHNFHVCTTENPHEVFTRSFQYCFSINLWAWHPRWLSSKHATFLSAFSYYKSNYFVDWTIWVSSKIKWWTLLTIFTRKFNKPAGSCTVAESKFLSFQQNLCKPPFPIIMTDIQKLNFSVSVTQSVFEFWVLS
jgi:hypothetical protein